MPEYISTLNMKRVFVYFVSATTHENCVCVVETLQSTHLVLVVGNTLFYPSRMREHAHTLTPSFENTFIIDDRQSAG